MTFDANRPETWPALLTVREVAAIKRRSVDSIVRKVRDGQFKPAPSEGGGKGNRYVWRREAVQRDVLGRTA